MFLARPQALRPELRGPLRGRRRPELLCPDDRVLHLRPRDPELLRSHDRLRLRACRSELLRPRRHDLCARRPELLRPGPDGLCPGRPELLRPDDRLLDLRPLGPELLCPRDADLLGPDGCRRSCRPGSGPRRLSGIGPDAGRPDVARRPDAAGRRGPGPAGRRVTNVPSGVSRALSVEGGPAAPPPERYC